MTDKPKRGGGFAAMDKDKLKEVSSKGGASVPAHKRAFNDPQIAREAARKGAIVRNERRRAAAAKP